MPKVRETILSAAAAAQGLPGADRYAMTHSWVFTGPPGSGRSVVALAFAQALVCTTEGELGCGHCQACVDVLADAHTDVAHIVPEGNVIGIDLNHCRLEVTVIELRPRRRAVCDQQAQHPRQITGCATPGFGLGTRELQQPLDKPRKPFDRERHLPRRVRPGLSGGDQLRLG